MKKPTLPALLILSATLAFAAWWVWVRPLPEAAPLAPTITRTPVILPLTASGEGVLEQTSLSLGFALPGTLSQIAQPGQSVQAGESLAVLEQTSAQLNLQAAQLTWNTLTSPAALASLQITQRQAQESLLQAQTDYENVVEGPDVDYYQFLLAVAEREYWQALSAVTDARTSTSRRAQAKLPRLNARLAAAETAWEEAKLALDWAQNYQPDPAAALLAEARLQNAQSLLDVQTESLLALQPAANPATFSDPALQTAWADLQAAQAALDASTLAAPFEGTVILVSAQAGEQVSAYQPILTLVAAAPLRVRFTLDETDLAALTPGASLLITPNAYPDLELPGVVTSVSPSINPDATLTVWGELLPAAFPVRLLPGMAVTVTVVSDSGQ